MGRLDKLYAKLPLWGQHSAVSAYGLYRYWLRFGPGYQRHLKAYQEREYFNPAQWQDWQANALRKILKNAAEHVPYYRENWSAAEKMAATAGDLQALPLLSKEPLRADPGSFLNNSVKPLLKQVWHTSGSTGTPVATHWTVDEIRNSRALREARSARWANVSFKLPRAVFSGRLVVPDPESPGPFHRYNIFERQVYFSAFHLSAATAHHYVEALHRHKIAWMTGYAVSFYLLARFMLEKNLKPPVLKAVITTSEKLTPEMRRIMEQAYQCRVFEEYSTVETALFANECEHGKLHISPDVSIVEILRPDGSACEPAEPGEIVTTCLFRHYQPLIRFRIGDVGMWDDAPCQCGCAMPVLQEVLGRLEDVVISPDGRQMVRFHGIFVDQPHIREGQIIQETLQEILVKIVPTDGFGAVDEQDIQQRVQQRLGSDVAVTVQIVSNIPRSKAGKFQAVISKIALTQKTTAP